jgi:hypothetical protein
VYEGWLQEEPIAKQVLLGSALMAAVRKPPSGNTFKIEGLVPLEPAWRDYKKLMKPLGPAKTPTPGTSPTLAETGAVAEGEVKQ